MEIDEIEIVIEAAGTIRARRRPRDGHARAPPRGTRTDRIVIAATGIEIGRGLVTATVNEGTTARAAGPGATPEAVGRTDIGRAGVERTTRMRGLWLVTTIACEMMRESERPGGRRQGQKGNDRECVFDRSSGTHAESQLAELSTSDAAENARAASP